MPLTTKPTNTTENPGLEAGATIAPREIRELIARLTEQSVEAVPAHEARTLEGLAIETGISVTRLRDGLAEMRKPKRVVVPPAAIAAFIALIGVGYWAIKHTPPMNGAAQAQPPSVIAPVTPVVETPVADLTNTVPLSMVTFGPDAGDIMVDRGFEPTHLPPDGLSVNVQSGKMMWGSGDHRATAIDRPLTPDQEKAAREAIEELLRYVREDAPRRHLGTPVTTPGAPGSFMVQLGGQSYHGSYGQSVTLPPPGKENDPAAEKAIHSAAKHLIQNIQNQLQQTMRWERESGP